jgi:hypothetical protein
LAPVLAHFQSSWDLFYFVPPHFSVLSKLPLNSHIFSRYGRFIHPMRKSFFESERPGEKSKQAWQNQFSKNEIVIKTSWWHSYLQVKSLKSQFAAATSRSLQSKIYLSYR